MVCCHLRRIAVIEIHHRQISVIVHAGVPAVVVKQIFQIAVVVHIRGQNCVARNLREEHIPADLMRFAIFITLDNPDFLPRLKVLL